MSRVRTFFRHCPGCGRRFEIRLVGREAVQLEGASSSQVPPAFSARGYSFYNEPYVAMQPAGQAILKEASPSVVDAAQFTYTYKCSHCGHQWTEKR